MLILICGPFGVGKSTIIRNLALKFDYKIVRTFTTRKQRSNEPQKICLSHAEFAKLEEDEFFVFENSFRGELYGTPAEDIHAALHESETWLLDFSISRIAQSFGAYRPPAIVILPMTELQLTQQLRGDKREDAIADAVKDLHTNYLSIHHDQPLPNQYIIINHPGKLEATIEAVHTRIKEKIATNQIPCCHI